MSRSKQKVYLSIPFTGIEDLSFRCANEIASLLIKEGLYVFSPISHSYPIWKTEMVEHTHEIWLEQDKAFVEWSDRVYVVILKGYEELTFKSYGVTMERKWAEEMDKPVVYLHYDPERKYIH